MTRTLNDIAERVAIVRAELERLGQERARLAADLEELNRQLLASPQPARAAAVKVSRAGDVQHLQRAAQSRDDRTVARLLKAGADPNARNADGETPLLLAVCTDDNAAVVRRLLGAGADVNAADPEGDTPLLLSVDDSNYPVVAMLVEGGADVNARNKAGDTPLTNAACWGSRRVVEFLLRHGAEPNMPDGEGLSPAQLARQQGHDDIADRLEQKKLAADPSGSRPRRRPGP